MLLIAPEALALDIPNSLSSIEATAYLSKRILFLYKYFNASSTKLVREIFKRFTYLLKIPCEGEKISASINITTPTRTIDAPEE